MTLAVRRSSRSRRTRSRTWTPVGRAPCGPGRREPGQALAGGSEQRVRGGPRHGPGHELHRGRRGLERRQRIARDQERGRAVSPRRDELLEPGRRRARTGRPAVERKRDLAAHTGVVTRTPVRGRQPVPDEHHLARGVTRKRAAMGRPVAAECQGPRSRPDALERRPRRRPRGAAHGEPLKERAGVTPGSEPARRQPIGEVAGRTVPAHRPRAAPLHLGRGERDDGGRELLCPRCPHQPRRQDPTRPRERQGAGARARPGADVSPTAADRPSPTTSTDIAAGRTRRLTSPL